MVEQIRQRLIQVRSQIAQVCQRVHRPADSVRLITVTKTFPTPVLQAVLDAGNKDIGENRVQEIEQKVANLHGAATIHLIGHLQSNKVLKVVPYVDWIQSIDSLSLLQKIDAACHARQKKMNILIQVKTCDEVSKSGCLPQEIDRLCEAALASQSLCFRGCMTIGPLNGGEKEIRTSFSQLRNLGRQCEAICGHPIELSMGMSQDFIIAIEEGSTMVRIGSLILGTRG
ncbi:MAG: YggS family pyridoxal phosphate-dependent enzyme [Chitinivibrionales bacterium]|nr:YggS family pyridoxal phosphate-dependent enzyme [Chitinivibrionales bacterium]